MYLNKITIFISEKFLNVSWKGSGPLAAFLLRILGHKWTTLIGALMSCVAFLLTGLLVFCDVKNIIPYYVITGGLAGTGFGFMYLPAMTIINHWFDKNMGLATGIAAAGSGVGQFALAPLCEMLLQKVGLTWSFLIIGAIAGLGLAFGVAYIMPSNQDEESELKVKTRWTFFRVRLVFECDFEITWSLGSWDLGTLRLKTLVPLPSSTTSSYFLLHPPISSSYFFLPPPIST